MAIFTKRLSILRISPWFIMFSRFSSLYFSAPMQSIALVGFGLDSIIESLSGFILIWRLCKHEVCQVDEERTSEKSHRICVNYFLLAWRLYASWVCEEVNLRRDSRAFAARNNDLHSFSVIMPLLSFRKRELGMKINSRTLVADYKETLACAFLLVSLMLGLTTKYFRFLAGRSSCRVNINGVFD